MPPTVTPAGRRTSRTRAGSVTTGGSGSPPGPRANTPGAAARAAAAANNTHRNILARPRSSFARWRRSPASKHVTEPGSVHAAFDSIPTLRAMPLPSIAIVGRPNVGKSSLLNMIARDMVSIVDPTPGVTRDRVSIIATLSPPDEGGPQRRVEITDTGGYGVYTAEGAGTTIGADLATLTHDIEHQISEAVRTADVVLFVLNAQAGVTPQDEMIARCYSAAQSFGTGNDGHPPSPSSSPQQDRRPALGGAGLEASADSASASRSSSRPRTTTSGATSSTRSTSPPPTSPTPTPKTTTPT